MGDSSKPTAFSDATYQTVPSVLLTDLTRQDAHGMPVLRPLDIVVYALLKGHAFQKDWCNPGYKRLAGMAAHSEPTIQRSLRRLEHAGHIVRKCKNGTGKIFLLTDVEKSTVVRRDATQWRSPAHRPFVPRPPALPVPVTPPLVEILEDGEPIL